MLCVQFIFKPGTYDDEFHRLDGEIDTYARSLPGYDHVEIWNGDGGLVNAMYYFADQKVWLCDFSGGPSLDLDGGSSSVIVTALASVREGLPTVEGAEQRTLADDEDLGLAVRLDACGDCFWCLADRPP